MVWCLTVKVTRRGESTFIRLACVKLEREVSDPCFVFQDWHRAPPTCDAARRKNSQGWTQTHSATTDDTHQQASVDQVRFVLEVSGKVGLGLKVNQH